MDGLGIDLAGTAGIEDNEDGATTIDMASGGRRDFASWRVGRSGGPLLPRL